MTPPLDPNPNTKYVILLTTCVEPATSAKIDKAARKELYTRNIKRYLEDTNLHIAVIESSGHTFDIPSSHRFQQATVTISDMIKDARNISTVGEAISVIKAQELGLLNGYTHAIKVTGKYYLPELEKVLLKVPASTDIIYQSIVNGKWQNSEVFGFNVENLKSIFEQFLVNVKRNLFMEQGIYNIHQKLGVKSHKLPPLNVHEKVARGDGSILPRL